MKTLAQILAFSLMVVGGYSWFSNSIPQLRAEPPSEESVSLEGMTMESFVALGQTIFEGKGTCPLCHNAVGHRAPLLVEAGSDGPPVAARAPSRLADGRYHGTASKPEEYLRESMVSPSAFVVEGFGKPGTGDSVSPMPDVSAGSIKLSPVEIDAVIAYMQSAAGVDITVPLPTEAVETAESAPADEGAVKDMGALAEKYECKLCHIVPGVDMAGEAPDMGPDLNGLKRYAKGAPDKLPLREYLRLSIVEPNRHVAQGFEPDTMPPDFADRMRVSELDLAVESLARAAEGGK
ncbi:MAG: hypothetical protein HY804_07695 [Nitrospinae bacterium]|nr:hypothetical protein [Nitrospinota bacterium]